MASDVEVLRRLLDVLDRGGDVRQVVPYADAGRALTGAISALEAREAQPKAEGRMDDTRAAKLLELWEFGLSGEELRGVINDWKGRRASEAALKDQVVYWKERADIEAGEVAALSERAAQLEELVELARQAVASEQARINHARAPAAMARLANALREYAPPSNQEPKP